MKEFAILRRDAALWGEIQRWVVLAPHPDDFDAVAVTMRRLADAGAELWLEVMTGGASGVEDQFLVGWEAKTAAREAEQRASCELFGLAPERIRFHRLAEDAEGHMLDDQANEDRVRSILDQSGAGGMILPHGNDTNADHRRTFRFFDRWAASCGRPLTGLLIRDPKTRGMRIDLVTPFDVDEAEWKGGMLRCHCSQHERNLRTRGHGMDSRILDVNRALAAELGLAEPFAEGFEVASYGKTMDNGQWAIADSR